MKDRWKIAEKKIHIIWLRAWKCNVDKPPADLDGTNYYAKARCAVPTE